MGVLARRPTATPCVAAVLAASLVGTGCVSLTHVPFRGDGSHSFRQVVMLADPPPRPQPELGVVPGRGSRTHAVLQLYRPRPCGESPLPELAATAYLSRADGPKRWVIVLPIWGSSTYPPRRIVHRLLTGQGRAGTNVLWVHGPERLVGYAALESATTEAELLAEVSRTAACIDATVEDVRSFLDWVFRQPDTDPRRVGIVGFSIGAIVGSLVMGRDARVATGVLAMGGGHLEQIFGFCDRDERVIRERATARFGWTLDDFTRAFETPLAVVDPVLVAGAIDPARVLYIDAGRDNCIPQSARDDLWRALGKPERITLNYTHRNSFLTMTPLGLDVTTRRIIAFLDRQLAPSRVDRPSRASVQARAQREP